MNDKAIYLILSCVDRADGLLNRGSMARLLMGQASRSIMKNGLDHVDEFGALADMSKADIISHIDYFIDRGCLSVSFLFFPKLQITEPGLNRLASMPKLELKEAPLQAEPSIMPKFEPKANKPHNEREFWFQFENDLIGAKRVIILSPFVDIRRVRAITGMLSSVINSGGSVVIYTKPLSEIPESEGILNYLRGIGVVLSNIPGMHTKIAIIDDILWEGSLNILSHWKGKEQMRRFRGQSYVDEAMIKLNVK